MSDRKVILSLSQYTALRAENQQLSGLLRWALSYVPEPLPNSEGGEFANTYHEAAHLCLTYRQEVRPEDIKIEFKKDLNE